MPGCFGPFSQTGVSYTDPPSPPSAGIARLVTRLLLLVTHQGDPFAPATGSSLAAICVSHPKVPRQGGTWLFCLHNLPDGCPGKVASGWARTGPHLCRRRYKFRLGGGRWLPLLGAGLCEQVRGKQPPSSQRWKKKKKKEEVVLSSAPLQSPLRQALLLQGKGGRKVFFIPFVIQQGKGRSWAV